MSWTFSSGITATGSVQFTPTPSSLWHQLEESKEFREEFSALQLKRGVAFQIRALLKKRGWTQETLAEKSGLTQGVVSRAQNPNYGNLTVNTVNRIAAGFDTAFVGQFVPFSKLVEWFESLSEDVGEVQSFEKENEAIRKGRTARTRVRRRTVRKGVRRKGATTPDGPQQQLSMFGQRQVITIPAGYREPDTDVLEKFMRVASIGVA